MTSVARTVDIVGEVMLSAPLFAVWKKGIKKQLKEYQKK